jgi:hypothetical protein
VIVNLDNKSCHSQSNEAIYKVSDYSVDSTNSYHCRGKHAYSISKKVLQSDFIINIPKPKTHRLAGITAAQKNIVGIVHDKASLPHRKIGSPEDGGDEYKKKSIIKHCIAYLEEKKLNKAEKGNILAAIIYQVFIVPLYFLVKIFFNEKNMIGSWPGNDTIWRTVADLNLIVKYADDKGIIYHTPMRKILNVSDMIIAGQGNGPIGPKPKDLGVVLIGEVSTYMDALCCKIMGFNINRIPGLIDLMKNPQLGCSGIKKIYSNLPEYNKLLYEVFIPESNWQFEPHDSWKGHL